ncbi:unnamed protein product, partial [Vitis vinifera]
MLEDPPVVHTGLLLLELHQDMEVPHLHTELQPHTFYRWRRKLWNPNT